MIIHPCRLTRIDTFRISTVGRLFATNIAQLLHAIEDIFWNMGCNLPLNC